MTAFAVTAMAQPKLRLTASLSATRATFGKPVLVRVTLENDGDAVFVRTRPGDFALEVTCGGATRAIAPLTGASSLEPRFRDVPLVEYARFSMIVPFLVNELNATDAQWLAAPGTYTMHVVYKPSPGDDDVWRGTLRSDALRLTIAPPSAAEQTRWRQKVRECVASDDCNALEVANYYRVMRDPAAADGLVALLEKQPFVYWTAYAVAHQGRTKELERVAAKVPDAAIAKLIREAGKDPAVCLGE